MPVSAFFIAFIITFATTPYAARYLLGKGISGVDLHKEGKIQVAEMGGLAVFYSVLAVLGFYYLNGYSEILYPLISICFIGLLGIVDGFRKLSAPQKIVSFYLTGVFLVWGLGFRGSTAYIVYGFAFMAAVNFTNMLAGFNGLEIGTGAIASAGIAIASYLKAAETSLIISASTAGALLAFLYYNRYPSKVFPGDVGTLIIGAALFSSILLGGLYTAGFIIFIPYLLDATLKFLSAGVMTRESQKPTQISDGVLTVPEGSNMSLARLILKGRPMTERELVRSVWALETLFVLLAISLEAV